MAVAVLSLTMTVAFAMFATPSAEAQVNQVAHNFVAGLDGGLPYAGLTIDTAGNLYGTSTSGGILTGGCSPFGCGGVYQLKTFRSGLTALSSFVLTPIYSFAGGSDGNYAIGRVAIGQDGNLYGTTFIGGGEGSCFYSGSGCGTVFQLRRPTTIPSTVLTPWDKTVLNRFTGGTDGGEPRGDLVFDQAGNIYGVTYRGGTTDNGVIYQLTPSGGGWTETVLYSVQNNGDGANPMFVALNKSGNLYGVFYQGGPHGFGAVFQLSPSVSGWTEQTLYGFTGGNDGKNPMSLIIDESGNLYGTTQSGGNIGCGTVFKLTPAGGSWAFSTLYTFGHDSEGCSPQDALVMDATGNLYGTLLEGGEYLWGAVFKLTPSNGNWTYTSLHDFEADDGEFPTSKPIFDASGNLYVTAQFGGAYDHGVILEITP
jgi:uncharacterized repeat protein (TIGR03803 family)